MSLIFNYFKVNYNDGGINDTPQDSTWQENLSDYNSDFSTPSDDDKEDDDFDEKNDGKNFNNAINFTNKIFAFNIFNSVRSMCKCISRSF